MALWTALGMRVQFAKTGQLTAAWVGTTWAIAASQFPAPSNVYLLQLCQ